MKNAALWLKGNPLYVVAGLVLAATLFSAGCQPTGTYKGEDVTAPQLESKRQGDLRKIEAQMRNLQAEAAAVQPEYEVAAGEIERQQLLLTQGLAFVGKLATTVVTGGVVNADDTITGGLSLVTLLLGGGYLRQRVAKKAEDKGYDMGRTEAIDTTLKTKAE